MAYKALVFHRQGFSRYQNKSRVTKINSVNKTVSQHCFVQKIGQELKEIKIHEQE